MCGWDQIQRKLMTSLGASHVKKEAATKNQQRKWQSVKETVGLKLCGFVAAWLLGAYIVQFEVGLPNQSCKEVNNHNAAKK